MRDFVDCQSAKSVFAVLEDRWQARGEQIFVRADLQLTMAETVIDSDVIDPVAFE